jgi:hypothetical protein
MISIRPKLASSPPALVLALSLLLSLGCESSDRITSNSSPDQHHPAVNPALSAASGIPFGAFHQPVSLYGPIYSGGLLNPLAPESLLSRLSEIRAASGRVVLVLPGGPAKYVNADGTFNFELWKSRVARYSVVDFDSYINDGTVLGNFLIDQPDCSSCWGGQVIAQDMIEAMAQYSKSLWPGMTTMVRSDPTYLDDFAGSYVDLDAGWAQYVVRKGDINTYLAANVAAAQSKGLRLVVGLNLLNGGLNRASLTASQIKSFGSTLLGSAYACAFISWQYDATYFSRTDIKSALELLSKKAKRHAATTCYRPD